MNPITVTLVFDKALSVVSGRPGGIECYFNQIREIIKDKYTEPCAKVEIEFPEHIKMVTGSYLLGMFNEIYNTVGLKGIENIFVLKSVNENDLMGKLKNELKRSACY